MTDTLEEQVQALAALVKTLQAENAQLKQTVQGPHASNLSGSGGATSSSTSSSHTDNPTQERVYIQAPRERKCPRFSGKMSQDSITVEDWVEEARKSLAVRQAMPAVQATFLCDLLDGEAKKEVKFSSAQERDDPEEIFKILLENFGCDTPYVVLQKTILPTQTTGGRINNRVFPCPARVNGIT